MHILGLCNGRIHGNSEILLKAALEAAAAHDPSLTLSWIHIPSVVVPRNPKPLKIDPDIIPNGNEQKAKSETNVETDDREAAYNAIMDADALIIATPVYSHQPPGTLKALADCILGPYADVSEPYRIRERQLAGDPSVKDVKVDPRQLKPRVAGFIAVAGSGAPFPEQWTMALPTMHLCTYSIHARVIDQVVFPGFSSAGAVLADGGATLKRVQQLGEAVASQIGKPFDEAQYLGPEEKGSCPYCHLLKVEFRTGNRVTCIACGAQGQMVVGSDGDIRPTWEEDSDVSGITLKGKLKHRDDIIAILNSERPKLPGVAAELDRWKEVHIPLVNLPSIQSTPEKTLSTLHL